MARDSCAGSGGCLADRTSGGCGFGDDLCLEPVSGTPAAAAGPEVAEVAVSPLRILFHLDGNVDWE